MSSVKKDQILLYLAWFVAAIAMLGSLFFSEVMEFMPCTLCWYQRIAMYPLVAILLVGFFQPIKTTVIYALPISVIGWIIALWHNLLHYKIVPPSATPCRSGVPCSTIYINWFGFLTIPMLSFIAFSIIIILLVILNRRVTRER